MEQLAQQALGTRARLLRAFRGPVLGGAQLDGASSAPSTVSILLAAEVDMRMFPPKSLSLHGWTMLLKLQMVTP